MVQDPRPLRRAAQAFFARGLQEKSKQPDNEIKNSPAQRLRMLWARLRLVGEEPLTSARHAGLRGVWLRLQLPNLGRWEQGENLFLQADIVEVLFGATGRDSSM